MAKIIKEAFGTMKDGRKASLYTFTNSKGNQFKMTDYGCRVQSLIVPNKDGGKTDILMGYADVSAYEADNKYLGALIGRHANRIGGAKVTINGVEYKLEANDGKAGNNQLHSGKNGYHCQLWNAEITDNGLVMTFTDPDGNAGFPGELHVKAIYNFTDDDAVTIDIDAVSNKATVMNMTCHAYFNLDGFNSPSILKQKLKIFANEFTENDADSLPTGKFIPVSGTPMDFSEPTEIGARIDEPYDQLIKGAGYDHNYVISRQADGQLREAAYAESETTGVTLTCSSTLPGVQLYTGNYLDADLPAKEETRILRRSAFCFEPQYFPNAFSNPEFPQPIFQASEHYNVKIIYKAGLKK